MQQHTAGPYQVGQYEGQLGIYADNVKIATVETWIGETERAESEANARLIAASPDLLAALRWIAEHGDTGAGGRPAYHDMRDHARKAIAKAEGRP